MMVAFVVGFLAGCLIASLTDLAYLRQVKSNLRAYEYYFRRRIDKQMGLFVARDGTSRLAVRLLPSVKRIGRDRPEPQKNRDPLDKTLWI